jgi:microcystin degradation protein MlrC
MPRRYVIALIKHETNTFSPLPTTLSSFGHGNGPASGAEARAQFENTNTPIAAYLDIARRENADVVIPVAAESWPSGRASARRSKRWCNLSRQRCAQAATP